jgi:hypothetical protein
VRRTAGRCTPLAAARVIAPVLAVLAVLSAAPSSGAAGLPVVPPQLDERRAVALVRADEGVAAWLRRYPPKPTTSATFDAERRRWIVRAWSGEAGQIVEAVVDDRSRQVTEAWVGPQVAWKMARGRPGAFGGRTLTSWPVWMGLSLVFLLGLADLRRPLSLRNLDLCALLSFGVSLTFFNRGMVFASSSLAVVPLVYLLARTAWIGFRSRSPRRGTPVWPTWALLAATLFLVGFRVGMNVQTPRTVIDVGYAGVIGADRILDGRAPWGSMPQRDGRKCGPVGADGERRDRVQPDGRCETPNPRGDTYGPVSYLVYLPAVALLGWSGQWDALPAAHATSIGLDLLTLVGLGLVGLRLGGRRLAATLAFAWAAFPFTAYVLMSNTNDALMPAALVWGFLFASSDSARGVASALAGWGKLASLPTVPLWLTYPNGPTRRGLVRFSAAFLGATAAAFAVLLLEPSLGHVVRTFWDRTIEFQIGRESPFSIWGWGQYHAAGLPDLGLAQRLVQAGALVLAGVAAVLPRRKGPLELAALTASILLAVQLSLTHWFYLYLPWVLPFVVLALVLDPRDDATA